ncbi:unnamed protein product [Gongylonema pulchrum]|uniref:Tudor domain-containing protein n=1 Tax=Gongylonema pulchrum TaxID=637853 RepID=A0A183DY37_9BILA|nr:unnamed protein product [Gongylonema pulchrum]
MDAEEASVSVWAPNVQEGFILCKITDIGSECLTLQPINGSETIQAFYEDVFPAEKNNRDVDDNCIFFAKF